MADSQSAARSNYFVVTNVAAFEDYCEKYGLRMITNTHNGLTLHGFLAPDGLPSDDPEENENLLVVTDLASLLAPDWVAVIQGIYSEQMRYLGGFAIAINHKGEIRSMDLDSIQTQASELGLNCTPAMY